MTEETPGNEERYSDLDWALFSNVKQITEMNTDEKNLEIQTLRRRISWLDDTTKSFLINVGTPIYIIMRSGEKMYGHFWGFDADKKALKVQVRHKIWSDQTRANYIDTMTSVVPMSNVVFYGFITDELKEEPE